MDAELGRYKKKVADQRKEIAKLKEQVVALEQVQAISIAYTAMLLKHIGVPVELMRSDVAEAVTRYRVLVDVSEDGQVFRLYCEEVAADGRER